MKRSGVTPIPVKTNGIKNERVSVIRITDQSKRLSWSDFSLEEFGVFLGRRCLGGILPSILTIMFDIGIRT